MAPVLGNGILDDRKKAHNALHVRTVCKTATSWKGYRRDSSINAIRGICLKPILHPIIRSVFVEMFRIYKLSSCSSSLPCAPPVLQSPSSAAARLNINEGELPFRNIYTFINDGKTRNVRIQVDMD